MYESNLWAPHGWQCPICKRVYSPTTPMCYSCGNQQTITMDHVTVPMMKEDNRKEMKLHPKTRKLVEDILARIKAELDKEEANETE